MAAKTVYVNIGESAFDMAVRKVCGKVVRMVVMTVCVLVVLMV